MADTEGRKERRGMGSGGGPDEMQASEISRRLASEGDPEDVETSVKERLEAEGIDVGSEDFDWITGESPHVGPTAGGG